MRRIAIVVVALASAVIALAGLSPIARAVHSSWPVGPLYEGVKAPPQLNVYRRTGPFRDCHGDVCGETVPDIVRFRFAQDLPDGYDALVTASFSYRATRNDVFVGALRGRDSNGKYLQSIKPEERPIASGHNQSVTLQWLVEGLSQDTTYQIWLSPELKHRGGNWHYEIATRHIQWTIEAVTSR